MSRLVIRLDVDENVGRRLIALLRAAGFDVVSSRDAHPSGTSDHAHLLICAQERRVLIAHDTDDFRLLHVAWHDWFAAFAVVPRSLHAGILRLPRSPELSTPDAAHVLDELLTQPAPEDFSNRLLEWSRSSGWEEMLGGTSAVLTEHGRENFDPKWTGFVSSAKQPPVSYGD